MSRAGSEQRMVLNPALNKLLITGGHGEVLREIGIPELISSLWVVYPDLTNYNMFECGLVLKKEAKPIVKEVQ